MAIDKNTSLKDFPSIYNTDRQELIDRITQIEANNAKMRVEYEKEMEEMRERFNVLSSQLINLLDQKLDEFEEKFVRIDDDVDSDCD